MTKTQGQTDRARRAGRKRCLLRRGLLVAPLVAAALVGGGLLAAQPEEAEAAFSGSNGKILVHEGDDLVSVKEDGSEHRNLTGDGIGAEARDFRGSFSPDGRKIAFYSDRDQLPMEEKEIPQAWLYVANADGSGARKVLDDPVGALDRPAWSPDGRELALGSNGGILIVDAGGSGSRRTVATPQRTSKSNPSWSPDGWSLAFSAYRDQTDPESAAIFTVSADGSSAPRLLVDDPNKVELMPRWVPSRERIVYVSFSRGIGSPDNDLEVRAVRDDGSEDAALPQTLGDALRQVDDWAWSPDGRKVVYSSLSPGYARTIDADGTDAKVVSQGLFVVSDWGPEPATTAAPAPAPAPAPTPNTAPSITGMRPAAGSATSDRTPLVKATVRDAQEDLTKGRIRVLVDGRARAFSYNPATGRASLSPPLAKGRHAVRIVATDAKGFSKTRAWSFRVASSERRP